MPKINFPFKFLYFVSFIFSMQYALVIYINSSFLENAVGEKFVGLIFTVAAALAILVLLEMPRVLTKYGNYKTSIIFVILNAAVLFSLALGASKILIVVSFLIYTVTNYCLVLSRDVYIEEYTKPGVVGQTRGIFLTIINLALVIAPSLAVLILGRASYFGVYVTSAIFTLSSLIFIFPHLKSFKDPEYKKISVYGALLKIIRNADLKRIYKSEFLLCFFYAWMIIYMPIYLHEHIGFAWKSIGLMFTIMLVPFVLLDYPLGKLSDKIGEQRLLILGFLTMSAATVSIFFLQTDSFAIWALVLFISRIGAATVEVMNESYFFKKIAPSDAELISFFRNMFPFAFIIAPVLAFPILLLVPVLQYLFLVLGAIMLLGFWVTLRLKDLK